MARKRMFDNLNTTTCQSSTELKDYISTYEMSFKYNYLSKFNCPLVRIVIL